MSVEPPGAPQEASGVSEECKLFVGGISWHMSGSELEESTSLSASSLYSASPQTPASTLLGLVAEFSPYGRCEATIMLDRHTGRSRGFGFVIFHKVTDAEEAIKALHETDVDGRKVSVTKAIPQSQTAPGTPAAALLGHRRGDRYGPVGLQPHPAKVAEPDLFNHLPTIRTLFAELDGHRYGDRRDRPYDRDDRYGSRSSAQDRRPGYDRGYGRPPDRGYDRPGYPDYSAYDRGYAEYDRDRYVPPPYGYVDLEPQVLHSLASFDTTRSDSSSLML